MARKMLFALALLLLSGGCRHVTMKQSLEVGLEAHFNDKSEMTTKAPIVTLKYRLEGQDAPSPALPAPVPGGALLGQPSAAAPAKATGTPSLSVTVAEEVLRPIAGSTAKPQPAKPAPLPSEQVPSVGPITVRPASDKKDSGSIYDLLK